MLFGGIAKDSNPDILCHIRLRRPDEGDYRLQPDTLENRLAISDVPTLFGFADHSS